MQGLVLIAMLLVPGPAPADGGTPDARKGSQIVCRDLGETGSRLARRRICMTRDSWAEFKRAQRAELERMQVNGGIPGAD